MLENNTKLSILMPVRNEGEHLAFTLKILHAIVEISHEVVVICDSLDDNSIPVVKSLQSEYSNLYLVINNYGQGVINAIRAGVNNSIGEYILIYAADEIAPILALNNMIKLMDSGCDFVSGTRYSHGGRRLGGNAIGGFLSRVANRIFQFIIGSALSDCTTGIKMFRRSIFDRLQLKSNPVGWAVAFEMSIKAQLLELKLGEVPITSIDRLYGGESTFRMGPWIIEYLRWFIWGITRLFGIKRASVRRISS